MTQTIMLDINEGVPITVFLATFGFYIARSLARFLSNKFLKGW